MKQYQGVDSHGAVREDSLSANDCRFDHTGGSTK